MISFGSTTETLPQHRKSSNLPSGNYYRNDPDSMAQNGTSDSFGPMFSPIRKRRSIRSQIMDIMSAPALFLSSRRRRKRTLVYILVVVLLGAWIFVFRGETPKSFKISRLHLNTNRVRDQGLSRHPIEVLVAENEQKYEKMVQRQSQTLEQAVKEYRKRYNRRPPTGFANWFELARKRHFILIDEWDTMMTSLEPYWGVHPKTMTARMQNRLAPGGIAEMTFSKSGITHDMENWELDMFEEMMSKMPWRSMISNVTIAVNLMDEPSVSVPYQDLRIALRMASKQHSSIDGPSIEIDEEEEDMIIHNFSHEHSWDALQNSCPVVENVLTDEPDDLLPFISDARRARDPCRDPLLRTHHGIWQSPANLLHTKRLVPMLSQAKPEHFNDILMPEPYYYRGLKEDWSDADKTWDERLDRVYWVGTANGGISDHLNWRNLQRQRMTILASPDNKETVSLLKRDEKAKPGTPQWIARTGQTWADLKSYFHIRVGKVEVCTDSCEEQKKYFKPQMEAATESYGSKYCLDIDGMGFSGRYLRLLRSNCAVMKQSVFVEFLDSWLVPWVHYIPITIEAKELAEITRFLIEEPEGQVIGEKIAVQGRAWSRKVLRKEDLELYFMRLLMELERIMSPDRNDMYYEVEEEPQEPLE